MLFLYLKTEFSLLWSTTTKASDVTFLCVAVCSFPCRLINGFSYFYHSVPTKHASHIIYQCTVKAARFWDISGAKVARGCFEFAAFRIRTGVCDNLMNKLSKKHSCWLEHRTYQDSSSQSERQPSAMKNPNCFLQLSHLCCPNSHRSSPNLLLAVQICGWFWITVSSLFPVSDIDANVLQRGAAVSPQWGQPQEKQSETRREPASGLTETCEDTAADRERRRNRARASGNLK